MSLANCRQLSAGLSLNALPYIYDWVNGDTSAPWRGLALVGDLPAPTM
ncbi:MAG: hypothetical protein R2867_06260 [Caldilineaceae bacterium]